MFKSESTNKVEIWEKGLCVERYELSPPKGWKRDHIAYEALKEYRKKYSECIVVIDDAFTFTNFKSCRDPNVTIELQRSA